MPLRAEDGLFGALEAELKKAKEPLDCNALFDRASVKRHAATVSRVSDYLGHMWRKGQVLRLPAPKDDRNKARWMYVWKQRPPPALPTLDQAITYDPVKQLFSKPNINVAEDGDTVIITLPHLTITIKAT